MDSIDRSAQGELPQQNYNYAFLTSRSFTIESILISTGRKVMENLLISAFEKLVSGNPDDLKAYLLEIGSNEEIDGTQSELHIHMLRLDGNNRPRINDLAVYLAYCIIDYCIPKKDIVEATEKDAKFRTKQYTSQLYRKAESLFTDLKNTGEGGELLLSIMMQRILGIPQLLCKMPLKTNPEVHYHGADGLYGIFDTSAQKFCLYWGESKIYSDLDQALSDCFDSIKGLLVEEGATGTQRARDLELFRDNIDFDNEELENAVLQYLNPDSEYYLSLEYRGACLVGYDEEAYPNDMSKLESEIFNEIKTKIGVFKSKINSRLKFRTPLDQFKMHIFIVPFSSVEAFRNKLLGELKCL